METKNKLSERERTEDKFGGNVAADVERKIQQTEIEKMKWYLISRNADGSISYIAQGTEKEMNFLCRFSFHVVTTISDYEKAKELFGNKLVRIKQREFGYAG